MEHHDRITSRNVRPELDQVSNSSALRALGRQALDVTPSTLIEHMPTAKEKAQEVLDYLQETDGATVRFNRFIALMSQLGFTPGEATDAFDALGLRMTGDLTIAF